MNLDALETGYLGVLRNYNRRNAMRCVTDHQVYDSICAKRHLVELFRKHPCWRENELRIVMNGNRERRFEYEAVENFANFLQEICEENRKESGEELFEIRKAAIGFILNIKNQYFSEDPGYYKPLIEQINAVCDKFKLRDNMKASKVIAKLCSETGMNKINVVEYDKAFSKLSDNINPKARDVISIWSLNPADFLLMSNGWNWDSCHLLDGDPEFAFHMAGTISYSLSRDVFMYFEIKPEDLDNITYAEKVVRQIFGYNDGILLQSRLYPQANDEGAEFAYSTIRKKTQEMIAKCLGEPSVWLTNHKFAAKVPYQDCDAAYPDWTPGYSGSENCMVSVLKSRPQGTNNINGRLHMGAVPTSVVTGEDLDDWSDVY